MRIAEIRTTDNREQQEINSNKGTNNMEHKEKLRGQGIKERERSVTKEGNVGNETNRHEDVQRITVNENRRMKKENK